MNFLTREGERGENSAMEIQDWSLPEFAIELLMRHLTRGLPLSSRKTQLDATQEPNGKDKRLSESM